MTVWTKDDKAIKALKATCSDGSSATYGSKNQSWKPFVGTKQWSNTDIENDEGFGSVNVSSSDAVVRGIGAMGNKDGEKRWIEWGNMEASRALACPTGKKIVGFDVGVQKGGDAIRRLKVVCG
jgi:hypothetical protein